jgi:hypothetical protein
MPVAAAVDAALLSSAQRGASTSSSPDPAFFRHRPQRCRFTALGAPRKPQLVVTTSQLEPASPASPWPILATTTITTAANDNHDRASAIPPSLPHLCHPSSYPQHCWASPFSSLIRYHLQRNSTTSARLKARRIIITLSQNGINHRAQGR